MQMSRTLIDRGQGELQLRKIALFERLGFERLGFYDPPFVNHSRNFCSKQIGIVGPI
jgi:hypothetical protein